MDARLGEHSEVETKAFFASDLSHSFTVALPAEAETLTLTLSLEEGGQDILIPIQQVEFDLTCADTLKNR